MAVGQLLGQTPENHWECYNRGVSGHKVFQLADRWQVDCLALKPDVLSILIGVNDFWHTLSHGYDGTVETYEQDYRALLDRTRVALPDVILIIGEPFAVTGGTALSESWYPAYAAYRGAAKRIAEDYGATWISYQSIFDEALMRAPVEHWCPDGVHPAPAGNYLMAQAWLDAFHTAVIA
jgi:lysophospholipase L1-like esterase